MIIASLLMQLSLDVAEVVEYVMVWKQALEFIKCRLEVLSQELATRQQGLQVMSIPAL